MHAAVHELYTSYRNLESDWLSSFSGSLTTASTIQECSLHYGEMAFMLAGLKPCVLIQLPTPDLTRDLYHHVLESHWMQLNSYKQQAQSEPGPGSRLAPLALRCQLITKSVCSPEMSLQGCVLVWSNTTVQSHLHASVIQKGIDQLLSPSSSADEIISEHDLAIMLDIPGRLPASELEMRKMIEVSYWHQGDIGVTMDTGHVNGNRDGGSNTLSSPMLLTAFAAQPEQIPDVQLHFNQYRDVVRDSFGIQLKLHIQAMADVI
ncbi:hypothetical protein EDD11_007477 [Mortierella claussenii]|nr:hypothetical protein EDD11_007477 [Mortierella claussenii]